MSWFVPLAVRDRRPELMDQPGLDPSSHHQALRGLARINVWSRSVAALWPAVAEAARMIPDRPVRVLDVATGAGDIPVALWRRARSAGVPLEGAGCDISPTALEHARRRAEAVGANLHFFQHDVVQDPLPGGYDVIICSLFLHHLSEQDALTVLARMRAAAGAALVVSDLVRSRVGYLLAWGGTRALSRSPVVHTDGPLSVRAAFTLTEVRRLAEAAGLTGARVTRHWPFRFLLRWSRP